MSEGDVGSVIDTLVFESTNGREPAMIHVAGDVFAIAYRGVNDDGFVVTVTIASDGSIDDSVIDSYEFDPLMCMNPEIIHIHGHIYAITHRGDGSDGFVDTITISDVGAITKSVTDSLEFDTTACDRSYIIQVHSDIYAIAYAGAGSDGWLATVKISSAGAIHDTIVDSYEFDGVRCAEPVLFHIAGNVYGIAYEGDDYDGYIKTVTISSLGAITDAVIESWEHDATQGTYHAALHIAGNVFAIAYKDDTDDGVLFTITISDAGDINTSKIDTLIFDGTYANFIKMIPISGNVYAIVYCANDQVGTVSTVSIAEDGTIEDTLIDSAVFEAVDAYEPAIVHIAESIYAIAYRNTDDHGVLKTIDIETSVLGARHELMMGIG